eukprot:TRINITY_DN48192_c0_g1_i1.p1 TRINITY_DN48192_c0_g1~~TRINITY_DN48192_c0_g1_i1.p1  ORF type:complete len:559 (-),score=115.04 TRINITY_DN48192_c0_g1_i1:85-1761(-)
MSMQRAWLREFNALGLQLRPQAAKLINSFLRECDDAQRTVELLVEGTKNYLKQRSGTVDSVIDESVIKAVISCMVDGSNGDSRSGNAADAMEAPEVSGLDLGDGVQIYNVLTQVHPFTYNKSTKVWVRSERQSTLFAEPESKARIYADRFHILLQRLLLEGKLVPEAQAALGALLPGQRVLTPVESLVGNPGRKLTFGLLSRQHDEIARRWVIEDLHKVFPVELEVKESDHLMTDGSFVLAEGEVVGSAFRVYNLDVPGAIPRPVSLERDQVPLQTFGGTLSDEQLQTLEHHEPHNPEGMYVVLSEVHLDSVRVLEKLTDLFQGYEEAGPPSAYVFMGSFCSAAFAPTAEGVRAYRDGFERLKFMMRSLEAHVQHGTRFIFVPGPRDPGAQTLPRVPLPNYLTADLVKEIPGVVMATNPCRVRHFSRELVFFRHDVLRLLRRHEAVPLRAPEMSMSDAPTAASLGHLQTEMVRFLLDQAHLVPLPLEESNVLWEYDHTLRLYPLPHAVFVGGVNQPFECSYQGCQFASVGPFGRDASFYAFYPVKDELEPCDVPDRAG